MVEVLLITIPIAPPWDESKKNMAWALASEANGFRAHLLTTHSHTPGGTTKAVWEPIYRRGGYGPLQKLSLLKRLMHRNDDVDVDHIFVDLSRRTAPIMRALKAWRRKPAIQTFATLPHDASLPQVMVGDCYIALSEHLATHLRAAGAERVTVVNPAVDLRRFDASSVPPAPSEFGIPSGRKVVLYAGSFRTQADGEAVSAVMNHIFRQDPDIHFVIASRIRRAYQRRLRDACVNAVYGSKVSDTITVLETVTDMPRLLVSCEVCIYPAVDLQQKLDIPLILLEALAMRTPIAYSDVAGMRSLSGHGLGAPVPVGAWQQFAEATLGLLQHQPQQEQLVEHGYQVVVEYFSMAQFVQKHQQVYESIR